jgi:DNA-binding CsgD family transcriptional regulator
MPETLTPIEHDVLRCAMRSLTQEQTAQSLNLSESTVQEIMHRIYRKLGITTHLELFLCVCSGAVKIADPEGTAA